MNLQPLSDAHLDELMPFVEEYHAFEGVHMPESARREAVGRLLAEPDLGAIWAVEAENGWIGYIALTYGYSIEFRGRDAFIDEFFIREPWRGRGLGGRVLGEIRARAAALGLSALHLEVARDNRAARALSGKLGFELRGGFSLMSLRLDRQTGA